MNYLQDFLDTLGAAGVLALGVLAFCGAFYFGAVQPAEREMAAQHRAADLLKARAPHQLVSRDPRAATLRRFHELFPPVEQLTDELDRLYGLARKSGLEMQQGEYRLEARGPALVAYRVTLPVRGGYTQIREFTGAVLAEMPIASIDALRFERKKVGEARLEAQVRLTIHLRSSREIPPQ